GDPVGGIAPGRGGTVEQSVAGTLRGLIVSGRLPEGTPLVQRDLAQRLGVSQTPVRLGLSELEREGLVEVGETGRALVSRLTREDFEEIYAARLGLEGLAARVGVVELGDDGLVRMRDRLGRLDGPATKRVIHESIRGAVDTLWSSLPSERELAAG